MRPLTDGAQCLAVTLSYDGIISSLTSAAEQVTGYSAQELVGRPVTQILADRSVFEVPQMMDAAREWGHWDGEIVHLDRSGRSLEAQGSMSSLTGRGNAQAGFLLVSTVIGKTALSASENAVQQRIAVRLRMFSHELNNPLAVIMGFIQLLLLNTQCSGKVRSDMEKVYFELNRLIQVVEKLHGYSLSLQDEYQPRDWLGSMAG